MPPLTTATAFAIRRQLVRMEEQRGSCDGAAGLGNQARSGNDGAHGSANLGLRYGDDAVDESLDVGEVAHADALRAQAVGNGAAGELRRPGDDFAGAKTLRGVAGQLRLDAEDFGFAG